jgi:hypothetical protein
MYCILSGLHCASHVFQFRDTHTHNEAKNIFEREAVLSENSFLKL